MSDERSRWSLKEVLKAHDQPHTKFRTKLFHLLSRFESDAALRACHAKVIYRFELSSDSLGTEMTGKELI